MERRITNALSLYAFALLGIFLLVAPWTPVWEQAVRALASGRLALFMVGGWARGTVSAVGVLDLAAAVQAGRALWAKKKAAPGTPPAESNGDSAPG